MITAKLTAARPTLIGHNLFTDLVYLYACFIGPLPESVDDFRHEIHTLFPRVIDTKFLATHADANASNSSLRELLQLVDEQADGDCI
ncbi:hypothetical protein KEM52_003253, partial [Ascosphaera acerosa]